MPATVPGAALLIGGSTSRQRFLKAGELTLSGLALPRRSSARPFA